MGPPVTDPNRYSFRSTWLVDAAPGAVFEVLWDIDCYSHWWPEIKDAQPLDDDRVRLRARSLLPYDLVFVGRRTLADEAAGVLELAMEGDLEGFSRFRIEPGGRTCRVTFEEEVVANKALLRRLAWIARPAFIFNHRLMMRHCRSGLQTYVSGFERARRGGDRAEP